MRYRQTPFLDQFKANLATLFATLSKRTGRRLSNISEEVAGDPKFASTFQGRDMRVGTYDLITSRISAIWPADLPWPDGIERPAPATMDALGRRRQARGRETPAIHPDWPDDQPWPADIPRPVASPKHVSGPGA